MSRRVQDSVRDQLVAAALAERPRRRRRMTAVVAVLAIALGATAVAEATRLLAVGDPVESLLPAEDAELFERYRAPNGMTVVATAPDPDYKYGWGVGVYTSDEGLECALAGNVVGNALGRERDGRFHPYGPRVHGSCGDLDRMPQMLDSLHIAGAHPRTVVFGRVADPSRRLAFEYGGERRPVEVGRGGGFVVVFEGLLAPNDFKLVG